MKFLIVALSVSLVSGSFHQVLPDSNGAKNKNYVRCATSNEPLPVDPASGIQIPQETSIKKDNDGQNPCSNDNFITWIDAKTQLRKDAEKEMYQFLYTNLMPFDEPNAESLGFHDDASDTDLPDGLSSGIVGPTISIALDAKQRYSWTDHVPKDIYMEFVGSFASVNEPRNNWRPLFQKVLQDLVKDFEMEDAYADGGKDTTSTITVEDIIRAVNQKMWDKFDSTKEPIFFKSGQTPLIYDPMSIIAYGYASCTGVSIFLIDALRTVGIPCRLAGTAAWNGSKENGNHSWIEFYGSDSRWHIMESKPASGGDDKNLLDPCQWWFCNEEKVTGTTFYAAAIDRSSKDNVVFPLAWDAKNNDVVGKDRTDFMRDLCSQC